MHDYIILRNYSDSKMPSLNYRFSLDVSDFITEFS